MRYKDRLIYNGLSRFISFLGKLSPDTGRHASRRLGAIWFAVDRKHRTITIENLTTAFGSQMSPEEIRRLAQDVFFNTIRMIFEYAWYYTVSPIDYSGNFRIKGIENVTRALEKKKGVLVVTAHLGNWELATAFGPMTGLPVTVVYRTIKSAPIDQYILDNRIKTGLKLFPLHNALDAVRQALARGEIIGLLSDQNTGHQKGVFVDFFGRKACTNKGLARLALSTGAPVLPIFFYRENGKFTLEIQPELPLIRTGNEETDIVANTQAYTSAIEAIVRRYPEQWFWIHKRWKTRPLDEAA